MGRRWDQFEALCALETDECVVWPATNTRGYGRVRVPGGKVIATHREVLIRRIGPAPVGHEAAHDPLYCTTKACMNYRHLRWATPRDNTADQVPAGTRLRGERSHLAKLTEEAVRQIRQLHEEGASQHALASQFGISRPQVSRIVTRAAHGGWCHVS